MSPDTRPTDALAGTLKRTELQRSASSIPDRQIVQVLTEIPAGVESGWHLGPDTGHMLSTYIVEVDQPLATFTG
jgi:hypothetical protein